MHDGSHWSQDLPGMLVNNELEGNLESFMLREMYLEDTIQTVQLELDLQKAFKQEKVDDSNAMHKSKCCPNNDVGIHSGQFSWRMLSTLLLTAAWCQHRQFQTQARCKSLLRKHRELDFKNNSPVERNIARWNSRLDWNAWLLQTNLISTVLNTKFENSHVFLSWYAEN